MTSSANPRDPGPEQPFISHLVELRDRLLRMVMAIVLVFLVLFPFANDIYTLIAEPIRAQLPEGSTMIATQVASPFLTPFKLALVAAVFVAMPYLLFQIWGFVAPGLYQHEKRLALPLVASSIVLFYLGMAFAYYVVFPLVFAFFTSVTPDGVSQMPDIAFYLEFVLKLFFAFGVAFEIPIATILLVAMGMTTPEQLATKRPYVIVGVFVAGMLLTPPDVVSQTLLAIPMWLLYEAGIFFSRFFQSRVASDEEGGEATSPLAAEAVAAGSGAGGNPDSAAGEGPDPEPAPSPRPSGGKGSSEETARRDPAVDDPYDRERFRPLTDEEMEAELDAIEAAEYARDEDITPPDEPQTDPVDAMLEEVMALRERDDQAGARRLLYRVLAEGDDDQRRVALNILGQLDG
jgi:sec-independent protein translocase protein TatC